MSDATDQYRELRKRTDGHSGRLGEMHCAHLACRPGCHDCCTDIGVSRVEYAAILEDLQQSGVTADNLPRIEPGAACAFLSGGLCGLYRFRPLICRTHGLPIAFLNDEASPPEASVSFCPKNFTTASGANVEFDGHNTLDVDTLNAELAEANLRFLQEQSGLNARQPDVRPSHRVPLSQLRQDLQAG